MDDRKRQGKSTENVGLVSKVEPLKKISCGHCGKPLSDVKSCIEDKISPDKESDYMENYKAFISEGLVSLVGDENSSQKVKILRDTGATQSIMLDSVLPLTENSFTLFIYLFIFIYLKTYLYREPIQSGHVLPTLLFHRALLKQTWFTLEIVQHKTRMTQTVHQMRINK